MTEAEKKLIRMNVAGLTLDPVSRSPIVLLKEEAGERIVPIWIGLMEAHAIAQVLEQIPMPRPLTHDLMANLLSSTKVVVEQIEINDLKDNTFYATIVARTDTELRRIDSRPSDAIALALRMNAPILVADDIIEQAKAQTTTESEGEGTEKKDKWSEILENLSPEAFGKYRQ